MNRLLSMVAILALSSMGAMAAGTAAGVTVSNTASLSYSVGGATQPTVDTTEAATFVVDKKIDFSVVHNDDPKVVVTTPGAVEVEREFTLKNTTNFVQDFTLSATNLDGAVYVDNTDNKDVTNIQISIDDGVTWAAVGTDVTVSDLGIDATLVIKVRSNIPVTNVNGDVMNIQLEATAVKSGTTTAEVVTGAGDDGTISADRKDEIDVVLAEGAGYSLTGNTAFDGRYSAWAGYRIEAPVLTLTKSSCVYKDLVSGVSANAKRIPGATITYLLDIENTGSIDASDINITDDLPAELDGATVTAVKMNDNQDSCVCTGGVAGLGTDVTVVAAQTVKINSLTAKQAKHNCVSLQVKIK
jgi:uncharacterized repeat protein (TIGR01451 family)